MESKGLRVNVKKTKMMISSENVEKVTIEVKIPCAAYREGTSSNSRLCQLYRCCVRKRCGGIRDTLKENSLFCTIYC